MISKKQTKRIGAAAAAALGLAALLPMLGTSAAAAEDTTGTYCVVTGGELQWGVKESFRSYVSSSIANGDWQASDGASYATPTFTFSNASGEIDAATGVGSVSFKGTVVFTGHEGVLNLTIADPTIEFIGDGTARLRLDAKSNDSEGKLAIDEAQVSFGKIDTVGELRPADGSIALRDSAIVLTADGAAAFSGFYASGDELDPVTMTAQFAPCAAAADAGSDPSPATPATPSSAAEFPWLPVVIGGAAVLVIAVATGLLIAGRKKSPAAGADSVAHGDDESGA